MPEINEKSFCSSIPRLQSPGLLGALATELLPLIRADEAKPVIYVARDGRRAQALMELIRVLDPRLRTAFYPAWDCSPYDRVPPSRAVMGVRMGVLRWLTNTKAAPDLVLTTAEALIRRVPPRSVWPDANIEFHVGEVLDIPSVETALKSVGYIFDDRVDEPGEAALRGRVIDLYPAASPMPCRIEHQDGRITAIHSYDGVTQRTVAETATLVVDPASEIVMTAENGGDPAPASGFPVGQEHWLSSFYPHLETVFDYAPMAGLVVDDASAPRAAAFFEQISEGYESELAISSSITGERSPGMPAGLYLTADEWRAALNEHLVLTVDANGEAAGRVVPRFATEPSPWGAFAEFVEAILSSKGRVVLADGEPDRLRTFVRRVEKMLKRSILPADDWDEVWRAPSGNLLHLPLPLDRGFVDPSEQIVVLAAADLFGGRANAGERTRAGTLPIADARFRIGDAVVHIDSGVGVLEGLEELTVECGAPRDVIRLGYAGGSKLMVPVEEIGLVWRYGADSSGVALDRLNSEKWKERRAEIEHTVRATAKRMAELAEERNRRTAPKLVPPALEFERFVARFPYELTADQEGAVEAVLADLASGRPMNRLICGDVGYGKTEVALRASAAAALAGKQVAIVVPTTVLVRQHLDLFRRRFAGLGIEVAQLSRLLTPAEVRRVKERLASGEIKVVVGTHALLAKSVAWADLALVVIDEEQRFGAGHKQRLQSLSATAHLLSMTATPIPRTFQGNLVGLQDLSVIATPPVLRQPIRTLLSTFDPATVSQALTREKQRGGQSFVVCPRIEDIGPMASQLRKIVPNLATLTVHGKMPAAAIDDIILGFAKGKGDVLLATNIIESGLDIPKANTMIVWRADRFGLAQLHQLRGRVGRSSRRGVVHLLTEPGRELHSATRERLETLLALDQLGAGFAISAKDLDLRGAGDLFGEEQTGHMRLIGIELYQHLLQRALKAAGGQEPEDDTPPEIALDVHGRISRDYIPEDEVRLDLYSRLARVRERDGLAALEDEIVDRFGPLPDEMSDLLAVAELKVLCHTCGVSRVEGGPKGIAASFRTEAAKRLAGDLAASEADLELRGERLFFNRASQSSRKRLDDARNLLVWLIQRLDRPEKVA